jgi:hypothetical protein
MEILLEIFFEFLIPLVGEILFDVFLHQLKRVPRLYNTLNVAVTAVMYFGVGLFLGWLSILIFPNAFVRSSRLHGISLLITPVLGGLVMSCIGWIRMRHGSPVVRLETFSLGFIFAFGMALIRLLFTV